MVVDGAADVSEVRPLLALVEPLPQATGAELPGLLAAADPDAHPQAMPAVGEAGDHLGVLLGPGEEIVRGDDPVGRAGPAAIALETRPDERLVGQVVAGE